MKKLLRLLILLFAFYLLFQIIFNVFSNGYKVEYNVSGFDVVEVLTQKTKGEYDNYYFEISTENNTFSIQTLEELNLTKKVIKEIKYYKDDQYECILPILKNDTLFTDAICSYNNNFYYYHDLKGNNSLLDQFMSSIEIYDGTIYNLNEEIKKENNYITAYQYDIPDLYMILESYKGVYFINQKDGFTAKDLFTKDTYSKDIHTFIKNYYVTADYSEDFEFHDFYVVNIKNYSVFKITSNNAISIYSYIQGSVGNSVYLIDTSAKKQYEINIKTKTVIEVGNDQTGIKNYQNGEWTEENIYDAINNKLLFTDSVSLSDFNGISYARVDKVGGEKSGFYYLYENTKNGYDVYRVNVQNSNSKIYLFTTNNIDNIVYDQDRVCYKDDVYIKCYQDSIGVKLIVKNKEISFNNSLIFDVAR
jgi:hypothetical protein